MEPDHDRPRMAHGRGEHAIHRTRWHVHGIRTPGDSHSSVLVFFLLINEVELEVGFQPPSGFEFETSLRWHKPEHSFRWGPVSCYGSDGLTAAVAVWAVGSHRFIWDGNLRVKWRHLAERMPKRARGEGLGIPIESSCRGSDNYRRV